MHTKSVLRIWPCFCRALLINQMTPTFMNIKWKLLISPWQPSYLNTCTFLHHKEILKNKPFHQKIQYFLIPKIIDSCFHFVILSLKYILCAQIQIFYLAWFFEEKSSRQRFFVKYTTFHKYCNILPKLRAMIFLCKLKPRAHPNMCIETWFLEKGSQQFDPQKNLISTSVSMVWHVKCGWGIFYGSV